MIANAVVRGRDVIKLAPARVKHCRYFAHELLYSEFGEPERVLRLQESPQNHLKGSNVEVEWLAAPVNPSDINQVQGKYGIKPQLPAVAGNEGVGVVKLVGNQVRGLELGDRVVPNLPGQGTWREVGQHEEAALHKVSDELPLGMAATLLVNPPTAIRLLEDVVDLQQGDVVVQNGANSIVGQLVIQIAAKRGICTVNVVRERPQLPEMKKLLEGLGANVVTTEAELPSVMKNAGLPKPALALNAVGGSSSAAIASVLRPKGTIVTYGGLSMKPVSIPTGLFIFKDIVARGFWLSGGSRSNTEAASDIDRAADLYLKDGIEAGFDFYDLEKFMEAISAPKDSLLARKKILLTELGRQVLADR